MLNETLNFKITIVILSMIVYLSCLHTHDISAQTGFNTESILEDGAHDSVLPYLDSLILSLNNTANDEQRLELLFSICGNTVSGNADKCIAYGEEFLLLAEKKSDLLKQHSITLWMGVSFDDKGEYAKAIEMYNRSLDIVEMLGKSNNANTADLHSKKAILLNNIGYVYFNMSMYEDALNYYFKGLTIANQYSPQSKATILGSICELYFEIGDMDRAYEYASASIKVSKDTFDFLLNGKMMGCPTAPPPGSILGSQCLLV